MSYSFRQLFYAPISLARKFYFNASESQITHTMWAHLKHTHSHTHYLAISHSHTHSTVDRVRWHSEHVPFYFALTRTVPPTPAQSTPLPGNYPHIFWPQVEPFPLPISHFIRFRSNFWARSAKNNC